MQAQRHVEMEHFRAILAMRDQNDGRTNQINAFLSEPQSIAMFCVAEHIVLAHGVRAMTLNAMAVVCASITDLISSPPHMLTEEEANERESHVMVMLGQGSHRDAKLLSST